ncbi:7tm Odorant receptor [Popillia japonica]|uniref:7tm Odorant receptor n=1 Tax=Popillia japonica TaxID=7064 RepID=A0AAW1LYF3_POPJA
MIELAATTIYIIILVIEFAYWCFPAEEIADQLTTIANAIYMSSWYQEDRIVIKTQFIMMMRAQSQKFMSAGGLMDMNIDAFGSFVSGNAQNFLFLHYLAECIKQIKPV